MAAMIPQQKIQKIIYLIRSQRVMFDVDLAELYGVETKVLIRAVKRNLARFPEDFMFALNYQEVVILRSQIVTSRSWGGRRYLPYVFTEQGVAMLSSVLNSDRAVQVNVEIMRAFVRLRNWVSSNEEWVRKLNALEKKYDSQFAVVFDAIRELMNPKVKPAEKIGFQRNTK